MSAPTVTCERCGTSAAADDIFCSYCKNKLPEFAVPAAAPVELEPRAPFAIAASRRHRPPLWKLAAAGGLLVALVIAAVVVFGGDDTSGPDVETAMRTLPIVQWTTAIEGEIVDSHVDGDSTYVLARLGKHFEATRLHTSSGKVRWTRELNPSADVNVNVEDDLTGLVGVVSGDVVVLIGADSQEQRDLHVLERGDGDLIWEDAVDLNAFMLGAPGVVLGTLPGGAYGYQLIDDNRRSVGQATEADQVVVAGGDVYVDADDTLRRVLPTGGPAFAFEHEGRRLAVFADAPGGLFAGVDDRVIRLSATGDEEWSINARIGQVWSVEAMNDDRVMVLGDDGVRVVSAVNGTDVVQDPREFDHATVGPGPNGHDVVFAYSQIDADSTAVAVLATGNLRFTRIADITGFVSPAVTSVGDTAYVTDDGLDDDQARRVRGVELSGGRVLWELALTADDRPTVTDGGIIVINVGERNSVSYYSS